MSTQDRILMHSISKISFRLPKYLIQENTDLYTDSFSFPLPPIFPAKDNHFLHSDDRTIPFDAKTAFFPGPRTQASLLGHAGHSLLGCILQVNGRSDGQPAVVENSLSLLDVGS